MSFTRAAGAAAAVCFSMTVVLSCLNFIIASEALVATSTRSKNSPSHSLSNVRYTGSKSTSLSFSNLPTSTLSVTVSKTKASESLSPGGQSSTRSISFSSTTSPTATFTDSPSSDHSRSPSTTVSPSESRSPSNEQSSSRTWSESPARSMTRTPSIVPTPSLLTATIDESQTATDTRSRIQFSHSTTGSSDTTQTKSPSKTILTPTVSVTMFFSATVTLSQQPRSPSLSTSVLHTSSRSPTKSETVSLTVTTTNTSSPPVTLSKLTVSRSGTDPKSRSDSVSKSVTPSQTFSSFATESLSGSRSRGTPTLSVTISETFSDVRTLSPSRSLSRTASSSGTVTIRNTPTVSLWITSTPKVSATPTITPAPKPTPSHSLSQSHVPSGSQSASLSQLVKSQTHSFTLTSTAEVTLTLTASHSPSKTPTITPPPTPSLTKSNEPTLSDSQAVSASPTPTVTYNGTATVTITPPPTPSQSSTNEITETVSSSQTPTITPPPTPSLTASVSLIAGSKSDTLSQSSSRTTRSRKETFSFSREISQVMVNDTFRLRIRGDSWNLALVQNASEVYLAAQKFIAYAIDVPAWQVTVHSAVSGSLIVYFSVNQFQPRYKSTTVVQQLLSTANYSSLQSVYRSLAVLSQDTVGYMSSVWDQPTPMANPGLCVGACITIVVLCVVSGVAMLAAGIILIRRWKLYTPLEKEQDYDRNRPMAVVIHEDRLGGGEGADVTPHEVRDEEEDGKHRGYPHDPYHSFSANNSTISAWNKKNYGKFNTSDDTPDVGLPPPLSLSGVVSPPPPAAAASVTRRNTLQASRPAPLHPSILRSLPATEFPRSSFTDASDDTHVVEDVSNIDVIDVRSDMGD